MKKKNKLIYGVGINDADYPITTGKMVNGKWKLTSTCPFYERWKGILYRCYFKIHKERNPTYSDCTVCEEWLTFSNFKRWMESQDWKERALDKDFLVEGNKVYNPSTCMFIPSKLNSFTATRNVKRGDYPLGVSYKKRSKGMVGERAKPYHAQISNGKGRGNYLGMYSTSEEAHQRYLEEKLKYCKEYLKEFKDEPLIIKGLKRIRDKIQHHIDNNLELTSF